MRRCSGRLTRRPLTGGLLRVGSSSLSVHACMHACMCLWGCGGVLLEADHAPACKSGHVAAAESRWLPAPRDKLSLGPSWRPPNAACSLLVLPPVQRARLQRHSGSACAAGKSVVGDGGETAQLDSSALCARRCGWMRGKGADAWVHLLWGEGRCTFCEEMLPKGCLQGCLQR